METKIFSCCTYSPPPLPIDKLIRSPFSSPMPHFTLGSSFLFFLFPFRVFISLRVFFPVYDFTIAQEKRPVVGSWECRSQMKLAMKALLALLSMIQLKCGFFLVCLFFMLPRTWHPDVISQLSSMHRCPSLRLPKLFRSSLAPVVSGSRVRVVAKCLQKMVLSGRDQFLFWEMIPVSPSRSWIVKPPHAKGSSSRDNPRYTQ